MKTTTIPTKTDVLIIGAGPTGMALAIALQKAGVDHVLIDKLAEGQSTSRAAVIHAHTLEMLEQLGVAGRLAARGLKLGHFAIRDRDRKLIGLNFHKLPSRHPYLLMLPQDITESVFAGRLADLGGTIHRNVTAMSVEQDAGGARVAITSPTGEQVIEARYVVGGDGMHSIVRDAAHIEFQGGTYGESFVLADVRMNWPLGDGEVSLFFSPEGMVVVAPLPDGSFRVVATLEHSPERPAVRDIQALLDARGPASRTAAVNEVVWSSRFRVHHRVGTSYRNGRFFLMGDAAHVHSPAGGQGMNTGIVDAVVLGQLLIEVLNGQRPDTDLDAYGQIRRPAAVQVLDLAGRLTQMATTRGALRRFVRNTGLSILQMFPPAKHRLLMNLSGLSRKKLALIPEKESRHVIAHAS